MALTECEIFGHCRNYLGGSKCPKSVSIQLEPLPTKSAVG